MNSTVTPISAANAPTQTQQAAPPKQAAAASSIPQDTVTISQSAKQAQTTNAKPAASGDVDHDGDSH